MWQSWKLDCAAAAATSGTNTVWQGLAVLFFVERLPFLKDPTPHTPSDCKPRPTAPSQHGGRRREGGAGRGETRGEGNIYLNRGVFTFSLKGLGVKYTVSKWIQCVPNPVLLGFEGEAHPLAYCVHILVLRRHSPS